MKHRTNKPIVAYHVNQLWCIDLLDLNPFVKRKDNKNYRYIMNVIDVFSRKIFLTALKNKTAVNTMNGLKTIIEKHNVKPFYILCDSGAEFKGEFEKFCEENAIKIIHSRTYTPQSNGIVERSNQELRKYIKNYMNINGNNIWLTGLQDFEDTHNTTYKSAIKGIPDTVFNSQDTDETKQNILNSAKNKIKQFNENEFKEGDIVRPSMAILFSNIRKAYKDGNGKNMIINFSPIPFKIKSIIYPKNRVLFETEELYT
jgi:hypothetical protein